MEGKKNIKLETSRKGGWKCRRPGGCGESTQEASPRKHRGKKNKDKDERPAWGGGGRQDQGGGMKKFASYKSWAVGNWDGESISSQPPKERGTQAQDRKKKLVPTQTQDSTKKTGKKEEMRGELTVLFGKKGGRDRGGSGRCIIGPKKQGNQTSTRGTVRAQDDNRKKAHHQQQHSEEGKNSGGEVVGKKGRNELESLQG